MAKKDIFKREVKGMRDWTDQHDGQFPPLLVSVLGCRLNIELRGYYLIASPEDDPEMKLSAGMPEEILQKIVMNLN